MHASERSLETEAGEGRTLWTWLQHWIGPVEQEPSPPRGTMDALATEAAASARTKERRETIV